MQVSLVVGTIVFAAVLMMHVVVSLQRTRRFNPRKHLKLARVLVIALLAWMAISMKLSHTTDGLDGKPVKEPGLVEKILERF